MRNVWRLLLVWLVVLTACSDVAQLPTDSTPITAPAQHTAPAPTPSSPRTTISFAIQGEELAIYQPLVSRFHAEHPEIQVTLPLLDDLPVAAAALSFEEQIALEGRTLAQFADASTAATLWPDNAIRFQRDLAPFIATDSAFAPEVFSPAILTYTAHPNGAIYRLPRTMIVRTISYNRDLFQAAGIPEPTADWTWAHMRAAAEQLAVTDPTNPRYGLLLDGRSYSLLNTLARNDPALIAAADNPDDPAIAQAFRTAVDLVRRNAVYVQGEGMSVFNTYEELIANGHVGMWFTGMLLPTDQSTAPPFAVGTVPAPRGLPNTIVPYDGFSMSVGTQFPNETWRWLRFLSQQTVPINAGQEFGVLLPTRTAQRDAVLAQLAPDVRVAVEAMLARPPEPPIFELRGLAAFAPALNAALSDPSTADSAFAAQQQELRTNATAVAQLPPTPVQPEAVLVATPEPTDQGETIVFDSMGLDRNVVLRIAAQFRQTAPTYQIQLPTTPVFTLADTARQRDCFAWTGGFNTADTALVRDLRPLLDANPPAEPFNPLHLAALTRDGRLLALPYRFETPVVWYQVDKLGGTGLAADSTTWTLEEVSNAARQITNRAERQYGYASTAMTTDLQAWLEASGVTVVRGTGPDARLALTEPATVQALQAFLSLLRDASPHTRFIYGEAERTNVDVEQLISAGRVALWTGGAEPAFFTPSVTATGSELALAPFPKGPNGMRPIPIVTGLAIAATTAQPDGCWQWLLALSAGPADGIGGGLLVRERAVTPAVEGSTPTGFLATERSVRAAPVVRSAPTVSLPGSGAIDYRWLYAAMDAALQGANLDQALATAQQQSDQFSACVANGARVAACAQQVEAGYNGSGAVAP
jgi:multiple sugar transport system substrate-binding protein